jgi:hypothetical protein
MRVEFRNFTELVSGNPVARSLRTRDLADRAGRAGLLGSGRTSIQGQVCALDRHDYGLRLWNDLVFAEVSEEAFEHVLRIDAVVETSSPCLDGARDVVKIHETENSVGEGPRGNLVVG